MRNFYHALRSILIVGILISGIQSFAQTNVVPDDIEFQALKDFYLSTGSGSTWKVKTNWPATWPATATAAVMDTWYGIVVTNGDISGISMANNTTGGTLPASLNTLTALTSIDLSGNSIAGPIPDLSSLTKLVTLDLENNRLTSIHSSITALPALQNIYLGVNSLSGNVPPLTGAQLRILDLHKNTLSGPMPSAALLSNMLSINIADNLITALPTDLEGLTKIITIYAYRNKILTPIPAVLGSLSTLVNINFQENGFYGNIPPELGNLHNLKILSLNTNKLTGLIPASFSGLTNLESLSLGYNKLTGTIPEFVGDLTMLKTLSLSGNEFEGELPLCISKLTNLTTLYLSQNKFNGTFPEQYGNLVNLTHLYVDQNQLEGELPRLTSLTKLQYLFFSKNYFRGTVPSTYAAFTDIRSFYADNNYLNGEFPAIMNNWTKLTLFSIYNNQFTGDFPSGVGSCVALASINASHNRFVSMPASLLSLPALTSLNFRANKLTSIPDFTNYARASVLTLSVQNNQLGLDKIEPLYNSGGTTPMKSLVASPQLFEALKIDIPAGQPLLITAASKGTYGSIVWEKLSGSTWNAVNTINEDATQQTFKITSPTTEHAGQYRWRATTTKVSTWITQSEPITVTLVDAIPTGGKTTKLYNGLITSVRWRTNKAYDSKGTDLEGIYLYEYDEKYQIKDARFGKVSWAGGSQAYTTYQLEGNKYRLSGMSYDPNGNIQTLHRFNDKGERINNFTYHYVPNTNKLDKVDGYVTKYAYDEIGRMTKADKETGEDQYVDYDVTGKVTMVYADEAKTIKKVEYQYDDHGFRLAKIAFAPAGSSEQSKTTWYIRDAGGSVTAIYEQEGEPSLTNANPLIQKEIPIYGAGKLGTYYPQEDGSTVYELTDHLGNVRALVRNDVKTYTATMEDSGQPDVTNPRVKEDNYFLNIEETALNYAPMNHTSEAVIQDASYSSYLKWQSGVAGSEAVDKGVGPSIALKVNEGDEINTEVFVRFREQTSYPRNGFTLNVLASILGNSFFGGNGFEGSTFSQAAQSFNNALTGGGFLSDGSDDGVPHAYLNYMVLDGSKNRLASGYKRVTEDGGFEAGQEGLPNMHERLAFDQPIVIPANGKYIFIWVSNESEMTDVWFDDLMISHKSNFVKEATDYGVWGDVLRTSSEDIERKSVKDNLVVQYDLNGNANDSGGRGLNGTVFGAVSTPNRDGTLNSAYSFDGIDDKITIAAAEDDVSFIPNTGIFTISVFVKIDDLDKRNIIISNTTTSTGRGFTLMYENYAEYSHQLRFYSCVAQSAKYNEVYGNVNTINDHEWHHVVVVGDGSTITLYVDGYIDAYNTSILYYATGNSAVPLLIGNGASANVALKGAVDEIKIFDRTLTDAEIRLLANGKSLSEVDYVLNPTDKYRYGYQGQFAERDEETGWNHFELREYDPVIGRWTRVDPYGEFWSPYLGMGNNPGGTVDPTGGFTGPGEGDLNEAGTHYWGLNASTCNFEWVPILEGTTVWDNVVEMGKSVWTFGSYLSNAFVSDHMLNVGRWEAQGLAESYGAAAGDALATVAGIAETFFGGMLTFGGGALEVVSCGASTPISVPVVGTGVLITGTGISTTLVSFHNGTKHGSYHSSGGGGMTPAGRGSTGRTTPKNLQEEMAMEAILKDPNMGSVIMGGSPMNNPLWKGWLKMEYVVKSANGVNAQVHFVAKWVDGVMVEVDDFKFKD